MKGDVKRNFSPSTGRNSSLRHPAPLPFWQPRRVRSLPGAYSGPDYARSNGRRDKQPGVKDAHDGSIRGSRPTALSGGARGPSVRWRLASLPTWPILQDETHPQPYSLSVSRTRTERNLGAKACKVREARLLVLVSVVERRKLLLSSTGSKPKSRSCAPSSGAPSSPSFRWRHIERRTRGEDRGAGRPPAPLL